MRLFSNNHKIIYALPGMMFISENINPAFINMIGYSKEELFSFPINHLILDLDKKCTEEFRKNLKKGISLLNFENRYVTKSGELVWLTWTYMPVESEQLVYAIAKNITHIKKQELARNHLITELTYLNKEITQLSNTTTHYLKSPLNNLISLFKLLDVEEIKNEEKYDFTFLEWSMAISNRCLARR